jgi:hypothetical protein
MRPAVKTAPLGHAASLGLFALPLILACLVQAVGATGLTGNEAIPTRMRGAVLPGNSHVEMRDFDVPKPGHGQVRAGHAPEPAASPDA